MTLAFAKSWEYEGADDTSVNRMKNTELKSLNSLIGPFDFESRVRSFVTIKSGGLILNKFYRANSARRSKHKKKIFHCSIFEKEWLYGLKSFLNAYGIWIFCGQEGYRDVGFASYLVAIGLFHRLMRHLCLIIWSLVADFLKFPNDTNHVFV